MSLHRKRVKRLKLKQILILILRMLIIALLALALARPIVTGKWALAAGGRAKSSIVIVLDNSYSVSYERFDGNRFDIAKDKALRLLKSLRPGDSASLILMSDFPDVVFKQLTTDIQQVRDAVKYAEISHRGSHVWPSISEAYALLKESDHPYKAIYLISDLGENGWRDWKNMPGAPDGVDIFVIRIGEADVGNQSIETILLSNEPVGTGMPVQIKPIIRHSPAVTGSAEATVELFVDGEKRGQREVTKGLENSLSFTHIFRHPGTHIGEVRLTSDRLPLDDVRYFAIDVLGQIKVLCAGVGARHASPLHYINLALNPILDTGYGRAQGSPLQASSDQHPVSSIQYPASSTILPVGCTVEELGTLSLDQYSVVVIVDVAELPEDTARNLENFVLNGGSVVIFVGEAANRDWYNEHFGLMPATLGDRMSFPQTPLKLSKWSVDHPIFKIFRDESTTGALANFAEFYSVFSMEPQSTANVIASFDRDVPGVLEAAAGWGRIILFNSSPDTRVSDLPLRPVFLPLMQRTIFYLVSVGSRARSNDRNMLVGDTYIQHIQESIDSLPKLFDPEDNIVTPVTSPSERGSQIQYGPVERAGIYKLEFKSEGRLRRDYFAVNLDTVGESDLKAAKDGEVIGKLGKRARFASLDGTPEEIVGSTRTGSEVSSRLLIAAVILMLVEIPLANRRKV